MYGPTRLLTYIFWIHFAAQNTNNQTAGDETTDYGSKLHREMDAAAAKQKAGARLTNKEKKLLK